MNSLSCQLQCYLVRSKTPKLCLLATWPKGTENRALRKEMLSFFSSLHPGFALLSILLKHMKHTNKRSMCASLCFSVSALVNHETTVPMRFLTQHGFVLIFIINDSTLIKNSNKTARVELWETGDFFSLMILFINIVGQLSSTWKLEGNKAFILHVAACILCGCILCSKWFPFCTVVPSSTG